MPNLIHGQDPGGALRPIQVDDNGNLAVDLVSGVSVSTSISGTMIVDQLSGSTWSTNVIGQGVTFDVKQVSGSSDSVSASVDAQTITLGVNQVSGSSWSTSASLDAQTVTLGVNQLSGSAWSTFVTGSSGTQIIVGTVVADAADVGDAPVKTGGIARQTNPTAVADNDVVSTAYDDVGRQVMVVHQVRDLVATAYLSDTSSAETVLMAGVASTFLDLVQVVCANTSSGAVDIDFRTGTGGSVMFTISVPANSTAGFVPTVPIPQTENAQAWTADIQQSDLSGTTVNISAIFIKNV